MRGRKPLADFKRWTIRLNNLYPYFEIWKDKLLDVGISEEDISEDIYNDIMQIGGSVFVKWNINDMAYRSISLIYRSLLIKYKYKKELISKSLSDIITDKLETSQKNYSSNEEANNSGETRKYLNFELVNTTENTNRLSNIIDEVNNHIDNLVDPREWLVKTFIKKVMLPKQPSQKTKSYNRGGVI